MYPEARTIVWLRLVPLDLRRFALPLELGCLGLGLQPVTEWRSCWRPLDCLVRCFTWAKAVACMCYICTMQNIWLSILELSELRQALKIWFVWVRQASFKNGRAVEFKTLYSLHNAGMLSNFDLFIGIFLLDFHVFFSHLVPYDCSSWVSSELLWIPRYSEKRKCLSLLLMPVSDISEHPWSSTYHWQFCAVKLFHWKGSTNP